MELTGFLITYEIMIILNQQLPDSDPAETQEWMDSLLSVVKDRGVHRARSLVRILMQRARALNLGVPELVQTPYINTIPPEQEPPFPGDEEMEKRIRRLERWNAVVMVTRANKHYDGIGGHISTYASSASLYDVGFNHFFRGKDNGASGDQIFFQGHASPGIYARAFLEGRITEAQMDSFRREAIPGKGLSSYPHPRLMPHFWEFPTVSMGLGPLTAIYQARFNRYLQARGIANTENSRVWCFLGDGECDEPEALGSLFLASREKLDNLIFVVNCNLQRLDGPVRGNGKIIQELEMVFRGAGWNVIKVIWGREWDDLLRRDQDGVLLEKMNETVDGAYQKLCDRKRRLYPRAVLRAGSAPAQTGRAFERSGSAEPSARRTRLPETVCRLQTGRRAQRIPDRHPGQDRERLGAGRRISGKKCHASAEEDESGPAAGISQPAGIAHHRPAAGRGALLSPGAGEPGNPVSAGTAAARLGGPLPQRIVRSKPLSLPASDLYDEFKLGTGTGREVSTTMAFVRLLRLLMRDKEIGRRIVPIIPDEARTFGMDSMFREFGIYSSMGQVYEPVDAGMLLSYHESKDGQMLEEGITEAGSTASFTAAGTSYATHGEPMIPFYIFYSMFGFQRTGDLFWAFGDARGTGICPGRDGRAHDPERRRPAAPGRPQPCPGFRDSRICARTIRPSRLKWP